MERWILELHGMHCDDCARRVAAALGAATGVHHAEASYADHRALIDADPEQCDEATLNAIIRELGFRVIAIH